MRKKKRKTLCYSLFNSSFFLLCWAANSTLPRSEIGFNWVGICVRSFPPPRSSLRHRNVNMANFCSICAHFSSSSMKKARNIVIVAIVTATTSALLAAGVWVGGDVWGMEKFDSDYSRLNLFWLQFFNVLVSVLAEREKATRSVPTNLDDTFAFLFMLRLHVVFSLQISHESVKFCGCSNFFSSLARLRVCVSLCKTRNRTRQSSSFIIGLVWSW